MKRCEILLLASLSAAMICSCNDDKFRYSYGVVNGDLVLKTADGKRYLKYNDEADYSIFLEDVFYSSELFGDKEFKSCFNDDNGMVESVNSIDFSDFHKEDIEDAQVAEIAAEKYFNLKDEARFYAGKSGYGYQTYYVEMDDSMLGTFTEVFKFMRSKDNPGIQDGAVVIRTGTFIGEHDMSSTEKEFSLALCGGMKKILEQ